MMKKLFSFFCSIFFIIVHISALPAYKMVFQNSQLDGSSLDLLLAGDEHLHFYATTDGIPVVLSPNGSFYYAVKGDDDLIFSELLAHNYGERDEEEHRFIKEQIESIKDYLSTKWRDRVEQRYKQDKKHPVRKLKGKSIFRGERRGLVILVNFQDQQMLPDSPAELERMFNQIGYKGNSHYGSVQDYFFSQSYGQFLISFDVVGPIKVSQPYGFYGNNHKSSDDDTYPGQMVIEACQLVDDSIDFSQYDWDGNGEVNQVFIVYAGYGEASGGVSSTIWPHKYSLTGCHRRGDGGGPITLDGVTIDTYACSNELYGNRGADLMGIGAACHEFSHCLGLPDLYDTDYSGAFGMSYFDVMDSGAQSGPNGRGERPYGYSAFERWYLGWLELEEIESSQEILYLQDLQDHPRACIIRNGGNEDEFFILENHQNKGWYQYVDKSSNCHGLMVTHVDYNPSAWRNNNVNPNMEHQGMSIIPADGNYGVKYSDRFYPSLIDLEGDLFPGAENVTEFTNTSHLEVGGRLFFPNTDGSMQMNKEIYNIEEKNGIISFSIVNYVPLLPPLLLEPENITQFGFMAVWERVEGADSYTIELTEYISEHPNRIRVTQIDNIRDTSYSFSGLFFNFYTLRVKANLKGRSSEWSERIAVRLKADGISRESSDSGEQMLYAVPGIKYGSPSSRRVYIKTKNTGGYEKVLIHKR